MSSSDNPVYGNWVPMKMLWAGIAAFCVSCVLATVIGVIAVRIVFAVIAGLSGVFTAYVTYAWWLFRKNDGENQRKVCNFLIDNIIWDGEGKALDIGTGSGRVAIAVARRFPSSRVTGVDLWGTPWEYSVDICIRNAAAEGVGDRVTFQRGGAEELPFEDSEFDLVTCNYVFHTIKIPNQNRTDIIKEALRVLRDGGSFAFQDLFNEQFYGDIDRLYNELTTWGLKEVKLVNTLEYIHIPVALRMNHMAGGSKIMCGIK